jgi:hypothetical protein
VSYPRPPLIRRDGGGRRRRRRRGGDRREHEFPPEFRWEKVRVQGPRSLQRTRRIEIHEDAKRDRQKSRTSFEDVLFVSSWSPRACIVEQLRHGELFTFAFEVIGTRREMRASAPSGSRNKNAVGCVTRWLPTRIPKSAFYYR